MESKFQPFDIKNYCRVYFLFEDAEGKQSATYYERPQMLPDNLISKEGLANAEDMKRRFSFKELLGIYIARTPAQVKEIESQL